MSLNWDKMEKNCLRRANFSFGKKNWNKKPQCKKNFLEKKILKQNFLDFDSEKPKICVREQIFWKCKKLLCTDFVAEKGEGVVLYAKGSYTRDFTVFRRLNPLSLQRRETCPHRTADPSAAFLKDWNKKHSPPQTQRIEVCASQQCDSRQCRDWPKSKHDFAKYRFLKARARRENPPFEGCRDSVAVETACKR